MARGGSKLSGRGRRRGSADETGPEQSAWQPDAVPAPAAPGPARNILPGQPFEPAARRFPAQRPAGGPSAGWDLLPSQGGFDPSGHHADPNTISWPSEVTAPLQAVPASVGATHGGDPLDALQQYAGLPMAGYPGAAPAPDPTQMYQPQAPIAPGGSPHNPAQYGPPAATMSAGPAEAPPLQGGYGSPADSGFADGGIFTGSQPFDGVPAAPFAPAGYGQPGSLGSQFPPTGGHIPQSSLEPLDVFPNASGRGVAGSVLPDHDDHPAEQSGRGRRRRGKGGSRRDGARRENSHSDRSHYSAAHSGRGRDTAEAAPASHGGSRRAVALLAAVAVLGGAGYLGYTQLTGTNDAISSPSTTVRPATAATASKYVLPSRLANLAQVSPAESKQLTANYIALSKKSSPGLPLPTLVSGYRPAPSAAPTVTVIVYRPGAQSVYNALVGSLSRPAPGNAAVAAVPVASGAAGGTMMCGSQRGVSSSAWCAWSSGKGIGFISTRGTANPTYAALYTRELRAFAER